MPILILPKVIKREILSYLNLLEMCTQKRVCKEFHNALFTPLPVRILEIHYFLNHMTGCYLDYIKPDFSLYINIKHIIIDRYGLVSSYRRTIEWCGKNFCNVKTVFKNVSSMTIEVSSVFNRNIWHDFSPFLQKMNPLIKRLEIRFEEKCCFTKLFNTRVGFNFTDFNYVQHLTIFFSISCQWENNSSFNGWTNVLEQFLQANSRCLQKVDVIFESENSLFRFKCYLLEIFKKQTIHIQTLN